MEASRFAPLVEILRGEIVESVHFGSVVVSDNQGNIHFQIGDINSPAFLRSTAKPLQVLALIESQDNSPYQLSAQEIAVMCASHSGTDEHVAVIEGLQKKLGIRASDLQCGIHPPFDRETASRLIRKDTPLTPLRHNCSGKHSGMMALANILKAPLENYLDVSGPTQQLILKTCGDMFSVPVSEFKIGIDGCSAPVFAVPMKNAALAYARLCQPDNLIRQRAEACKKITSAMMTHPFLVAGPKRIDTALMQALPGKIIAKTGAEGFFGLGIQPSVLFSDSPALGIMMKISDGDLKERARPIVLIEILHHLGLLKEHEKEALKAFSQRPISNWRGLSVGEIRPTNDLKTILAEWDLQ